MFPTTGHFGEYHFETMKFETAYDHILEKINSIDPAAYGKTRNYADGAVTHLSPYISRGVISTKMVVEQLRERNLPFYFTEKLIQELAWRDYWQQVWVAKGEGINTDLLSEQTGVAHKALPEAILKAFTGIEAIDAGILALYQQGYMHNHMRMYVASVSCNIAKSHWRLPAQWMYYHLLDGDWASNALSWQWVAGCNAKKKYVANQENINTFFYTRQTGTFLDVSYDTLAAMACPTPLEPIITPELKTVMPAGDSLQIDPTIPTLLYNYYNLDPLWKKDLKANRVLLLEPALFEQYPISEKCMAFMLSLRQNIPGIQLFTGSFAQCMETYNIKNCMYKEHPLNRHYTGTEEPRDWIVEVHGYFPSFFGYWKKCKKKMGLW